MSIVEQPPLLFSQHPQSPSSPSFSSPPQSPNHLHHTQTPISSPPHPPPADDIDMSTSTTLEPPAGQNHDRGDTDTDNAADAPMSDSDGLTNGHMESNSERSEPQPPSSVAVEVAAVDDDAMDTSLDNSQGLVLPNGSADSREASELVNNSSAPNGVSQSEPLATEQTPVGDGAETAPPSDSLPPIEPPAPTDSSLQPPPPPAEPAQSDTDSSDEDGAQPWHPIHEDTSSPDEAELKEIEAGTEVSALDHEHWEKKAFPPLDDPEFTPGASGRIEWTIERYNGTKENPNRDLVMKSEVVTIGGYDWQIKFYPKGNDSDYLSVYVECLSVMKPEPNDDKPQASEEAPQEAHATDSTSVGHDEGPIVEQVHVDTTSRNEERQHAPLPLLNSQSLPKRKSVAAQVSVVLYNPGEPRVNYVRTCLHRFCTGSPDWGWTRFHGPHYDIPHRVRGNRQALLRNDTLAFTGYIRIVDDETNCLWEHHSRENPWDSFAMTGLQSLTLGEGANGAPGGNMISAVTSWLLFKPFRQLLYTIAVPAPEDEPFCRPKPVLSALQKILYMLRTQINPGAGAVGLDDLMDALEWYGLHERLDKLDVMEAWEVLRLRLEEELRDTQYLSTLDEILGVKRDYASGIPSYRVPVLGVASMQEAVNKSVDLTSSSRPLPQLLTIELDRQDFDGEKRSYVKLLNKVTLDDSISVQGTPYTLYGFVVHRQTLQSYLYSPVLRPEGPESKWYTYTDGKEENMVKCLTKRQAVDAHEGKTGKDRVTGNDPVAYIALYVRDDVAETAFQCQPDSEDWQVPQWLRDDVAKQQRPEPSFSVPPIPGEDAPVTAEEETKMEEETSPPEVREFQVIDSRVYLQHEGPGMFDAYDSKWQPGSSDLIHPVQLAATDGCKEIRDKLAAVLKDIKDPRQIKFWFLDAVRGMWGRPNLLGTGQIEYSSGSAEVYMDLSKPWTIEDYPNSWSAYRIWAHVMDFADLPELPKEEDKAAVTTTPEQIEPPPAVLVHASEASPSNDTPAPEAPNAQAETNPPQEDTPMSEPEEPISQHPIIENSSTPPAVPEGERGPGDTAMGEVEVAVEPSLRVESPEDIAAASNTTAADTEMGGTQEDLPPPPPPPPPATIETEPVAPAPSELQPPLPPPPSPPPEIYFFLKFFDAEAQTLESRGSHIVSKTNRVDNTVSSILGLPSDQKIELFEEADLTSTQPIKNRRSFAQNDLRNTAIIIAALPQTEEQRNTLATRAAFADPQSYLAYRSQLRNSPAKLNGHFTYSYFSSQYYKGEIKKGHRHGHGTRVYHSGATYEGSFCLSQRQGHGLYTFQNGDTYDGEWVANQQHGTGTFVEASSGNTYVGGWKNDKKFGEGVTHWKKAEATDKVCSICYYATVDAAFYDCGHVVSCLPCARRVDVCPICRKRVLSAMKLYYGA